MLSKKHHVDMLHVLIDNDRNKKFLQEVKNFNKFLFTYNDLINIE